jgi:hypothetical protein
MFEIIWPEKRVVSDATIKGWYYDLRADGDVEAVDHDNIEAMALELAEQGYITLARRIS